MDGPGGTWDLAESVMPQADQEESRIPVMDWGTGLVVAYLMNSIS